MASFKEVKTKEGKRWQVRVFAGRDANGKQRWISETVRSANKGDARKRARDIELELERGTRVPVKVAMDSLFKDLVDDLDNRSKSSWGKLMVDVHLRPFFGHVRADRVSTGLIQRYIASRRTDGVKNGTINRELTMLRRAFNLGNDANPPKVGKPPKVPRLREDPPRKGFFEQEQYEALLQELPVELKPVLIFGYHTGWRRNEIVHLTWDQVNLETGEVRLYTGSTKNDEGRTIFVGQAVLDSLLSQKSFRDRFHPRTNLVFFRHLSGEVLRDFRGAWNSACEKAGLWDEHTGKPTRIFHDLRRTTIRNLIRAGVSENVAMKISGHKTREVFDRYDIVNEQDRKIAGVKLGQFLASLPCKDSQAENRPSTSLAAE